MVGNSPVWQRLADEFGMRPKERQGRRVTPNEDRVHHRRRDSSRRGRRHPEADVVRRETLTLINAAIANATEKEKTAKCCRVWLMKSPEGSEPTKTPASC